jgi:hypothetical protein
LITSFLGVPWRPLRLGVEGAQLPEPEISLKLIATAADRSGKPLTHRTAALYLWTHEQSESRLRLLFLF